MWDRVVIVPQQPNNKPPPKAINVDVLATRPLTEAERRECRERYQKAAR
jgi:hypothetical protein